MTIELRKSDMDEMREINRKNEYSLLYSELLELAEKHQTANEYTRALIEYRLTDINFHYEVELLKFGEYDKLKEELEKEMEAENKGT